MSLDKDKAPLAGGASRRTRHSLTGLNMTMPNYKLKMPAEEFGDVPAFHMLAPGVIVKLGFEVDDEMTSAEWVWVKITGHTSTGYAGVLMNEPLFVDGLHWGAVVCFGPKNVLTIYDGHAGAFH